jgi:hypothetical protein
VITPTKARRKEEKENYNSGLDGFSMEQWSTADT